MCCTISGKTEKKTSFCATVAQKAFRPSSIFPSIFSSQYTTTFRPTFVSGERFCKFTQSFYFTEYRYIDSVNLYYITLFTNRGGGALLFYIRWIFFLYNYEDSKYDFSIEVSNRSYEYSIVKSFSQKLCTIKLKE